ncbi:MAG TPA: acyl-CoA synthetase FdrA [Thermoanaerobaculia bacterium]|nr:acyl-CoA synthetase FdrA [Thermoanaerobaculia bacterium]
MSGEPVTRYAVRPGAYHDSVVLMQLQRSLASLPGVLDTGVVMATPANLNVLATSGLMSETETAAGPHDLLIAVKAESDAAAGEALARVDALLQVRRGGGEQDFRPRSLASALKMLPEARWVLISVPGRYAAGVAGDALDHGRNVFLYSDNVLVADEVALKQKARAKGLLVLGPDCGTAVISGVGLGFANRVRRGPIGLVGASGTGLQAIMSHIHALGAGISQAIGTGGRDLSGGVGGLTAAQAIDLLRRDPETQVIVLISKPPAPEVAVRVLALARATGKPVVVQFLGSPLPGRNLGSLHFAASLAEAAEMAVRLSQGDSGTAVVGAQHPAPLQRLGGRYLRGLFSGGTLAYEALLGLSAFLSPVFSNAPLSESQRLADPLHSQAHAILDLGADEFTVGRLHPMIDQDLRLRRLRQEAADTEVGLILLDVVLGEGAHADPAGELAPEIERALEKARAHGRPLEIAVLVVGTDEDPQDLSTQISTLERAGAWVCSTVGELVEHAAGRLELAPADGENAEPVPLEAVQAPLAVVNVGLESFFNSLFTQGARAVQVDWKPPAGQNEKLAGILARMKGR